MKAADLLKRSPSNLVAGEWQSIDGETLTIHNPARPAEMVFTAAPDPDHAHQAIDAARRALPAWSSWEPERRFAVLERFAELAKAREDDLAKLITLETGKASWEGKAEAGLIAGKVGITLDRQTEHNFGLARVQPYDLNLSDTKRASAWFRPHGVMAVLGPFNFPAHLPNGHIVPALAMGNTVVFKPSDKTPATGQCLAEILEQALDEAGAPAGTFNLVQGAADIAQSITTHEDIDGILFTGSWPVGRRILEANLDHPGRIIALELGGNNPAVVMPDADLRQAAIEVVRGAFITTGQRCTCTRRLIVHQDVAEKFTTAVCKAASNLIVNDPNEDPCFMGPLVTEHARSAMFDFEKQLTSHGGEALLETTPVPSLEHSGGHYVTPSVVRVDRFTRDPAPSGEGSHAGFDEELFAPLLRVATVKNLDEAIEQANATRYGLAAAIFTSDEKAQHRFRAEARAGCVNVNCATAGASGKLPFGGLGLSGNHRPAGAYSLDYCATPVAGMTELADNAAIAQGMRFEDSWIN